MNISEEMFFGGEDPDGARPGSSQYCWKWGSGGRGASFVLS